MWKHSKRYIRTHLSKLQMCLLLGNQNAAAARHRRERGTGQYLCGRTSFTQAASGCSSLAGSITLNSSPADCSAQLSMAPQKTIHAQGQARTQGISQRNNFFNELPHPSQQPSFNTSLFFLKRSLLRSYCVPVQFIHWFLSASGETPTQETAQNQSAFLSPPPQVSQLGSPCMGNSYLHASPKGTAISDKCKETVAFLQYSLRQFSLKPTFLPLISILQGNYKEREGCFTVANEKQKEQELLAVWSRAVLPHLDVSCAGTAGTALWEVTNLLWPPQLLLMQLLVHWHRPLLQQITLLLHFGQTALLLIAQAALISAACS